MSQVCPHTVPYNDALDLWQSLHAFLDRLVGLTEMYQSVSLHSQDLAGFSVSIPLNRFLEAVRLLLCKAYDPSDRDLHDGLRGVFMTVDMTNSTSPMRLFRGRYCSPALKVYSIRMDLFLKAVELSFKFPCFLLAIRWYSRVAVPRWAVRSRSLCVMRLSVCLSINISLGCCCHQSVRPAKPGLEDMWTIG